MVDTPETPREVQGEVGTLVRSGDTVTDNTPPKRQRQKSMTRPDPELAFLQELRRPNVAVTDFVGALDIAVDGVKSSMMRVFYVGGLMLLHYRQPEHAAEWVEYVKAEDIDGETVESQIADLIASRDPDYDDLAPGTQRERRRHIGNVIGWMADRATVIDDPGQIIKESINTGRVAIDQQQKVKKQAETAVTRGQKSAETRKKNRESKAAEKVAAEAAEKHRQSAAMADVVREHDAAQQPAAEVGSSGTAAPAEVQQSQPAAFGGDHPLPVPAPDPLMALRQQVRDACAEWVETASEADMREMLVLFQPAAEGGSSGTAAPAAA